MRAYPALDPTTATGDDDHEAEPSAVTVFYNSACPLCRTVVERYRRAMAGRADILWRDVARLPDALWVFGIDRVRAARCVHVVDREGRLRQGVDAAIALWREMPGKRRWRARVLQVPGIHAVARWLYAQGAVPWTAHGH